MKTLTREQFESQYGGDVASKFTSATPSGFSFGELKQDVAETKANVGSAIQEGFDRRESIQPGTEGAPTKESFMRQRLGNFLGTSARVFEGLLTGIGKAALPQKGEENVASTFKTGIQGAVTGFDVAGEAVIDAGKAVLPENVTTNIQKGVDVVANKLGLNDDLSKSQLTNLAEKHPQLFGEGRAALQTAEFLANIVLPPTASKAVVKGTGEVIEAGVEQAVKGFDATKGAVTDAFGKVIPEKGTVAGIVDKGKEFAERVPRAVERGKEAVVEATERAEVIRKSTPAVGEAIKVNVPETTIDITTKASPATRADMLKQLDIADAGKKSDVRVTSVAGDSSAKQYKLIDDQRKVVGKQIEEAIDALPDKSVNMTPGLEKLAGNLAENGLEIVEGKVTRTSRSAHSTAELKAIQQLYDEAIRGIDELGTLDALSIHSRDRLFSKLKRESRSIEGLDDILVKVTKEDGTVGTDSIYNLFRDVYRTQLDELSPEMRAINTEYAKYRQFVDEMDNTIFKSSKTNQNIDPSLSAAINLRRIESNALSQPLFKQTADEMDRLARELGYEGSTPSELLQFALELETIYPNTVPKAGFSGGIRTGIMGALEKVADVGAPNLKDQQRALRGLLDEGQVPTAPVGAIDESVSSVKSTTPNPESGIINFGAILSDMFGSKKPKLVKKKGGGGRSITFKDSKTGKTVKLKNMTNANFSDWQAFLDSNKVKYKTGF